ncbi:MAG: hypothetical protein U0822_16545 [Anaerolineae bacterium]
MPYPTNVIENLKRFAKWLPFLTLLTAAGVLGFLLALPAVAGPAAQEPAAFHGRGRVSQPITLDQPPPSGTVLKLPLKADDWTVLLDENFDSAWPNGLWSTRDDNGTTSGEYYWANRCANGANHLNWAIGGGADGSALTCDGPYAANTNSWTFYGPIDLTNTTAGLLYYDY